MLNCNCCEELFVTLLDLGSIYLQILLTEALGLRINLAGKMGI